MKKHKVFVAGASGYPGRYVVKAIVKGFYAVRALVRK
jgi:nucleoside-diphosphate-sugar epimerase